jgi:hypothetical protein
MNKKNKNSPNGLVRLFTLVLIVVMLLAGVASFPNGLTGQTLTPTISSGSVVPTVQFPEVPPGGTTVISDYTYFHPSGLISLPHLEGWNIDEATGNEVFEPTESTKLTRVGSTFINGVAFSVVHAFAERDPDRKVSSVQDMDGFYTKTNLDGAWSNFTGGWTELNRRAEGDSFIINFQLNLDNNAYLGRQISRLSGEWMMVTRLVSPSNNPQLLDSLQNAVWSKYQLWPQVLSVPLKWGSIVDPVLGYIVKFPPEWKQADGSPGNPYTIEGKLGTLTITMSTRAVVGKTAKTEDEAKAYVSATWPNAGVQSVKAATVNDSSGFAVSYIAVDADGNKRSAVALLLNGNNSTLYTLNLQTSARDQDLLDPANSAIPVELTQIRNTFFIVPSDKLVPTLTPTATTIPPTPLPTIATTPTTGANTAPAESAATPEAVLTEPALGPAPTDDGSPQG